MMQQMLIGQSSLAQSTSALTNRIVTMENEIKTIKGQVASTSRNAQLPGKPEANPKTEYINSIELRSGTTLPSRELPRANVDIDAQKRGVEVVEEDEFVGDPYSTSLAREYAKEDAKWKKIRERLQAEEEEAERVRARKQEKNRIASEEEAANRKRNYVAPPPYVPPLPYPGRFKKKMVDKCKAVFKKAIEKVEVTMPLVDALALVPQHPKFIKEMVKERSQETESMMLLTHEASAIIQRQTIPTKLKDPGSFTIPCALGPLAFQKCLCDLGASGSLMPYSIAKRLGVTRYKEANMRLVLADRSVRIPIGIIEDFPVLVKSYVVPTDFIVLEMDEEPSDPIIFGRPFLATAGAIIDVKRGKIDLHLSKDEILEFNINNPTKKPLIDGQCFSIEEKEASVGENEEALLEIERLLNEEVVCEDTVELERKIRVGAPRIEFMGGYSTIEIAPPPKEKSTMKNTYGSQALGYGNDGKAITLGGNGLDSHFSPTNEKKVESAMNDGSKVTRDKSTDGNPIIFAPPSSTMILTPWKHNDVAIEYKIECIGRSKPFAKVKAILTNLKEKGQQSIQGCMGRVLVFESKEPPWSVPTSTSRA